MSKLPQHWQKIVTAPRHPLQDVEEPNLMRDIFPYDEVPRTLFDGETVDARPAPEIWMTDTTFRDGQQARTPFTAAQASTLFDLLHRLSGPNGVIRQSEFFIYSERDREVLEEVRNKGYRFPEVTAWIRANPSDFELVRHAGLKETGLLTSISDYHIFLKFRKSRRQVLDDFMKVVRAAAEAGLEAIRCHYEDVTRADFWGCVVPFTEELMDFSAHSGLRIKIRLCDTMGYGLPYPQAALPRSIPKLIYYLQREFGIPSPDLEWHGHNDFHKVHINGVTAWLSGAAAVNGTILGFGERTGNSPLEALAVEYASLTGSANGMDLTAITEIADYMRSIGTVIAANYPFAGENFNVTMAGIHADGVIKNEEIYNIFDTDKILKRPLGVHITDRSGIAGVGYWVSQQLQRQGKPPVDKRDPRVAQIFAWIEAQYAQGRVTAISQEEMQQQFALHFKQEA
ncbi:MAG TPA: 2-isopropylmalate synthase [bacterium]|nr:2-isopropylmalate synthase [bacterium]HPR88480.1 2-isopropylmalate synthase [bacterium]